MLPQFQSVQQIMSNEEMWIAFGETVEKFLCGESYWFLDEASGVNRHRSYTRGECCTKYMYSKGTGRKSQPTESVWFPPQGLRLICDV